MSFLKNIFNKPTQELHLLSLEKKIDFAFIILSEFTPLVSEGIEDEKQLKHNKELIKNSILFLFREIKRQPGKDYLLEKHLTLPTKEKYEQYLLKLALMLEALSNFSVNPSPNLDKYILDLGKTNPADFKKDLDAMTKDTQEKHNETIYYYSELDSIENDLKNNTSFKKIKFYDY